MQWPTPPLHNCCAIRLGLSKYKFLSFENRSGHGRPYQKSLTSAPKIVCVFCGPADGEKLFDPTASLRKGQALSGTGDSQRDSRASFAIQAPSFIARQADSHESFEFSIRAMIHPIRANRANRFARITPLSFQRFWSSWNPNYSTFQSFRPQ